jgi:hypothetical protein
MAVVDCAASHAKAKPPINFPQAILLFAITTKSIIPIITATFDTIERPVSRA